MNKNIITTPKLLLDPFSEKYITQRYVSWLNHPEVVKYSELRHRHHTQESCHEYYQSMTTGQHFFWAILLKSANNLHIGNISAHIDIYNDVGDVGILLGDQQFWGQGLGLEAWSAVCQFLLHSGKLRKVTAGAMLTNQAMVKIMQRSGMVEDGVRQKHFIYDGELVDVVHYCLFNTIPK